MIEPQISMPLTAIYCVFVFVLGLCIGSFANVCIYRIPYARSIVFPRSNCPRCGNMIAWFDNIPLLSIILLRGRCRACGGTISKRYFLVELLTGLLFLAVFMRYGIDVRTIVFFIVITGLIIGTFVDFDHMIIPDQVTVGGIFAGLVLSAVLPVLHGAGTHFEGIRPAIIGIIARGMSLWIVGELGRLAFKKEAMGMGDVKLLAAMGAFLGWQAVVFIIMVSSLTGAAAGVAMVITGNKSMSSKIPFGPYLALSAVIWILGGCDWWAVYLQWMDSRPLAGAP